MIAPHNETPKPVCKSHTANFSSEVWEWFWSNHPGTTPKLCLKLGFAKQLIFTSLVLSRSGPNLRLRIDPRPLKCQTT